MPELPEVETVKRYIELNLGLAEITGVNIYCNSLRRKIPADFAKKAAGARIAGYRRIGKYIAIGLSNGFSIVWHLGMSGRITCFAPGNRPAEPGKHDHVVVETSQGSLVYNDARRFGLIDIVETSRLTESPYFASMGIDPFDAGFRGQYILSRARGRKTPVKAWLLDQKMVAGIGNIYAAEALYQARVSPLREAGSLSPGECESLAAAVVSTMEKAIEAGGSTLRDYRKPDGNAGYFQQSHCVYNKTGQKCPHCVCSSGIERIVQAGRSTFYCPTLQK